MKGWVSRTTFCAVLAALAAAVALRLACVGCDAGARPASRPLLLDRVPPAVVERMEAKHRLTQEVIAGRQSLLAAAAAFKALDDQGPPCPGWVCLDPPPGVSMDENYCRMVIEWVRNEAPGESGDELACPLEAELYDRLQRGTLQLPAPAGPAQASSRLRVVVPAWAPQRPTPGRL